MTDEILFLTASLSMENESSIIVEKFAANITGLGNWECFSLAPAKINKLV